MELYLIRHGETAANLKTWDKHGIFDVPLTTRGEAQSGAFASWSAENLEKPDRIYTSTLQRAIQTTSYLETVYGMTAQQDDRLREVGQCYPDMSPVPADGTSEYAIPWVSASPYKSTLKSPKGENLLQFRGRLGMMLQEIIDHNRNKTVYVICHGFAIDTLVDLIYGASHFRQVELWSANTGFCHFTHIQHLGRESWRLHCINRVEHLKHVGGASKLLGEDEGFWHEEAE